jgi:hypothetical protein
VYRSCEFANPDTKNFRIHKSPTPPVLRSGTYGPHSCGDREIAYRDIAIPVALVHETLQVPIPDMGDTCPPLQHYYSGAVAFRSFATSLAPILSSPRTPIYRSPMHVRTYSSTSPLSRRYIGYREIAISDATIPLSLETPKCRTPTPRDPLTRVPADGRFKLPSGYRGSRLQVARVSCFRKLRCPNSDSSGSLATRPRRWTVQSSRRDIANRDSNMQEVLASGNPDSPIHDFLGSSDTCPC